MRKREEDLIGKPCRRTYLLIQRRRRLIDEKIGGGGLKKIKRHYNKNIYFICIHLYTALNILILTTINYTFCHNNYSRLSDPRT